MNALRRAGGTKLVLHAVGWRAFAAAALAIFDKAAIGVLVSDTTMARFGRFALDVVVGSAGDCAACFGRATATDPGKARLCENRSVLCGSLVVLGEGFVGECGQYIGLYAVHAAGGGARR